MPEKEGIENEKSGFLQPSADEKQKHRSANLLDFLEHVRNTCWSFEDADFEDLDARDMEGESVLHCAVIMDEPEIVKELIDLGVELNFPGDLGCTPLHYAASFGRLNIAKILVEGSADIESLDEGKMTPLHKAVLRERMEIVEYLVSHGANLQSEDIAGRKPIDFAEPDSPLDQYLREAMANLVKRND